MWPDVLFRLKLITKEEHQQAVQNRPQKAPKGYALGLSLAVVSPISGWILSLFYTTIIAAAFSLLFQFLLGLVVLFLVIIPSLGSTAHIWKKHMSHIGSPKKRLGSRVLHLVELKKQVSHSAVVATDQTGLTRLAAETQLVPVNRAKRYPVQVRPLRSLRQRSRKKRRRGCFGIMSDSNRIAFFNASLANAHLMSRPVYEPEHVLMGELMRSIDHEAPYAAWVQIIFARKDYSSHFTFLKHRIADAYE